MTHKMLPIDQIKVGDYLAGSGTVAAIEKKDAWYEVSYQEHSFTKMFHERDSVSLKLPDPPYQSARTTEAQHMAEMRERARTVGDLRNRHVNPVKEVDTGMGDLIQALRKTGDDL